MANMCSLTTKNLLVEPLKELNAAQNQLKMNTCLARPSDAVTSDKMLNHVLTHTVAIGYSTGCQFMKHFLLK